MKRNLSIAKLFLLIVFFLFNSTIQASNIKPHGVVYELDSADIKVEKATLNNIKNHLASPSGPDTRIELVIHGGGYHLLVAAKTDISLQSTIDTLKLSGVKVKMCNNTLVSNNIDYNLDLYDVKNSDIVPSGVAYLADKQFEGWAYLHP